MRNIVKGNGQNIAKNLSVVDKFMLWLNDKFIRYKVPFLSSMIVGLLTYMFMFTNKIPNHDDVEYLFGKGAELASGRWGLSLMSYIFPDFSMPWIYGIVTIILISISVCITVNIFNIQNKIYQGLLGGLIIAFPSLVRTFNFMFTSTSYGVSFILAVLSVYFLIKREWYNKVIALTLLVFSVSIYQAYVAITASFLLIYVIQMLIDDEVDIKDIIKKGVFFVLFLAVSLAVYYGITQIILLLSNQEFNEYASDNINIEYSLLKRILFPYYSLLLSFIDISFCLIPTWLSSVMHIAVILIVCLECILLLRRYNNKLKVILFIFLIALLPMAINCLYLFVDAGKMHVLTRYSFVSLYVICFVILESIGAKTDFKFKNLSKDIVSIFMFIIIITNVYFANQVYLSNMLRYENMYSLYTSLITQIKTSGLLDDEDTKIAIIGESVEMQTNNYELCKSNDIGVFGEASLRPYSYAKFIKYYIGFDAEFATDEEIEQIAQTDEFKNMERYPYYGSIQKIDDYLVVKFSDLEEAQ